MAVEKRFAWLGGFALALLLNGCSSAPVADPWADVEAPTAGPPASIGSYAAGCLRGGVSLPPDGPGFEVMRIARRHFYGHPELISFIEKLGRQAQAQKLGPLLVGDLGQARGGPTVHGHASHQIGLDVDLWFERPPKGMTEPLSLDARENLSAASMVRADGEAPDVAAWGERQVALLGLAASNPLVERIFVNPALKRSLCAHKRHPRWLGKLRPWWGHDDHFHVRLKCPDDSPLCKRQDAVAWGDGCDTIEKDWFSPEAREATRKMLSAPAKPWHLPPLPPECEAVLKAPGETSPDGQSGAMAPSRQTQAIGVILKK